MSIEKFVKSESELKALADCLKQIALKEPLSVVRYKQTIYDICFADRGRKNINQFSLTATYNVENITEQIFSSVRGEELFPETINDFELWRERTETHYVFSSKGIALPTETHFDYRTVPSNYDCWDDDLTAFSADYRDVRITREFGVEQRIVLNSTGGLILESKPFLNIYYRQGYEPHMVTRTLGAYVSSNDDVERLTGLIDFMPDPTPDERIRNTSSFADSFAKLHDVSREVVYPTLKDAGLSDCLTHDVIMLSGVSAHEIFGHQFEEPIHPVSVGQQSLFPIGKNVQNANLILSDNPLQKVNGLEVIGSYRYDSYGRPAQTTTHIDHSSVVQHLGGEYIDKKNVKNFLGVEESTYVGCSRQGDDGHFPQPRMSCTVLQGRETIDVDWDGKVLMAPFNGYVLDGNFFKVMASECYVLDSAGEPKRLAPLEGSRAIYDAIIGMHILPGQSYHTGSCFKPGALDERVDSEVAVSFLANHQLWEHLTLRSL